MTDGFLAINASPSSTSKTSALVRAAVDLNGGGDIIDIGELDAQGLLGRTKAADVGAALEAISDARTIFIATPIYRASYSGLLKVLFDQLQLNALTGKVCVLAATGGSSHHYLAVDTALRPMIASLNGLSTAAVVYATSDDFSETGQPTESLVHRVHQALAEADALSASITLAPRG